MMKILILGSLLALQTGCALLRSTEDEQRISAQKRYMREREESDQAEVKRVQERAAQAEADRVAHSKYLAETPADERMLDSLCETANDLFKFAIQLDDEQLIARGSGSFDLSAANELGYKILNLHKALKVEEFRKAFKRAPDIDRCAYINGLSKADQARATKVIRRFETK